MLSLCRHLEDFGLLHLHWVQGWLDTCVRNLFTGSLLDAVLRFSPTADCRYCISSTCCVIFGTLTIFSITCGFCTSMICSTTRSTCTFHLSVLNHWDAVNNFNDLLHRAILHGLLCYDLRNFHDFSAESLRLMPPVSHIDDLLCCASSTSITLIIFSASSPVSFSPTFFITIRCKIWGCRLHSLSDGMVNFFALRSQPRVFLCQSSPCQRHCRPTLRGGSPRQTTRCSRSCQSSHVC